MIDGIEVEFLWSDEHIDEVRIRGSNGRFGGTANVYLGKGQISEVATLFRGFPSSGSDSRAIEIGNFDPESGGGGARLRLRCASPAGEVFVDLELQTDRNAEGRCESSAFRIAVEAAAIDNFVAALDRMHGQVGAKASLAQAI